MGGGQLVEIYPAGRGSALGRREPKYSASQVSSFGTVEEPAMRGMEPRAERSGGRIDESRFPAGSGSYYTETSERPISTAGPESYFGRVEGEPRARGEQVETVMVQFPAGQGRISVRKEESIYPAGRGSAAESESEEIVVLRFPAGSGTVYIRR